MIVDLGPLPYRIAIDLISWCVKHNIDQERAMSYIESMAKVEPYQDEWILDIPEKYVSYFMLKWQHYE